MRKQIAKKTQPNNVLTFGVVLLLAVVFVDALRQTVGDND